MLLVAPRCLALAAGALLTLLQPASHPLLVPAATAACLLLISDVLCAVLVAKEAVHARHRNLAAVEFQGQQIQATTDSPSPPVGVLAAAGNKRDFSKIVRVAAVFPVVGEGNGKEMVTESLGELISDQSISIDQKKVIVSDNSFIPQQDLKPQTTEYRSSADQSAAEFSAADAIKRVASSDQISSMLQHPTPLPYTLEKIALLLVAAVDGGFADLWPLWAGMSNEEGGLGLSHMELGMSAVLIYLPLFAVQFLVLNFRMQVLTQGIYSKITLVLLVLLYIILSSLKGLSDSDAGIVVPFMLFALLERVGLFIVSYYVINKLPRNHPFVLRTRYLVRLLACLFAGFILALEGLGMSRAMGGRTLFCILGATCACTFVVIFRQEAAEHAIEQK